ncbi:hypothetical protein CAPTEDRAFT_215844 [Capitella teleta]|uniref:Uncharacterized protein n=1 Tax=Capitella teleta TaxID=283909 RepID=R7VAY9_CAPTE|nr:hypothetical protein CAPTEDRAFT_215844 [Capitella teleta]|eukprot:ELU13501.1 hypothetical protein CAPTEDRAFT_215844 [Capitella teleta]
MDLNGVIDFIASQDDDAFALTSCEISFEDDLCLGREHLDLFESLIEELETISRVSACHGQDPYISENSRHVQGVEHAAVHQVALQFCDDIVTRPANFAPPFKDTNTETVTDHQSEIIMYITGAVLHNLRSGMLALIEVMTWMSSKASSATKKERPETITHCGQVNERVVDPC